MIKKIGAVSLGCDKNRVDTENVLYSLSKAGYEITADVSVADILIVNTCAFITPAVRESIDTIFELAEQKKSGRDVKLIVMGCFAERFAAEVSAQMPEVDAFIGINSYHKIAEILDNLGAEKIYTEPKYVPYEKGRLLTTPAHYAYLKIADGCDNFCTYCTIPFIRGRYRSEPMEKLIDEAKELAEQGVKELILVAQDTTRYGWDLYGYYALKDLLKELVKLDFYKIRLLYAYPELVDDELIKMLSQEEKLAKYIDVPLQHAANSVLKRMNRRNTAEEAVALLERIKSIDPDIAVRSTFIVGFPGETEEEFEELKTLVGRGLIDYAGFFAYSREQGTAAYKMPNQCPYKLKKSREKELSKLQCVKVTENHAKYLGRTLKVIYEGIDYTKNKFFGRIEQNAPEIDTKVLFTSDFPLDIGEVYEVKITKTDFNLFGETIR